MGGAQGNTSSALFVMICVCTCVCSTWPCGPYYSPVHTSLWATLRHPRKHLPLGLSALKPCHLFWDLCLLSHYLVPGLSSPWCLIVCFTQSCFMSPLLHKAMGQSQPTCVPCGPLRFSLCGSRASWQAPISLLEHYMPSKKLLSGKSKKVVDTDSLILLQGLGEETSLGCLPEQRLKVLPQHTWACLLRY